MYLKSGVSKELIEEIHEEIYLQTADAQHDVFLSLCSVTAVVPPRLLSLHPQESQLLKLEQESNQRSSDQTPGTEESKSNRLN